MGQWALTHPRLQDVMTNTSGNRDANMGQDAAATLSQFEALQNEQMRIAQRSFAQAYQSDPLGLKNTPSQNAAAAMALTKILQNERMRKTEGCCAQAGQFERNGVSGSASDDVANTLPQFEALQKQQMQIAQRNFEQAVQSGAPIPPGLRKWYQSQQKPGS